MFQNGLQFLKNQYTSAENHSPTLVAAYKNVLTSTVPVRCSASTCVESSVCTPLKLNWSSLKWLIHCNPYYTERNISEGNIALPEFQKLINFQLKNSVGISDFSPVAGPFRTARLHGYKHKNNKHNNNNTHNNNKNKNTQNQNTNNKNKTQNLKQNQTHLTSDESANCQKLNIQMTSDVSANCQKLKHKKNIYTKPFLWLEFVGKQIIVEDQHQSTLHDLYKRIKSRPDLPAKPNGKIIGYRKCSRPAAGIKYWLWGKMVLKVNLFLLDKRGLGIFKILKAYSFEAFQQLKTGRKRKHLGAGSNFSALSIPFSYAVAPFTEALKRFYRHLGQAPPIFYNSA